MKAVLRVAASLGLLVFGGLLLVTLLAPVQAERAAAGFIRMQVEARARATLDDVLGRPGVQQLAARLAGRYGDEIGRLRDELADGLPEKIAAVVARMQDLDCSCRAALAAANRKATELRIGTLGQMRDRLVGFIEGQYVEVTRQLLHDLRIFTGSNAVMFLLLLAVSLLRQRAAAQLLVPGLLMVVATLVASGVYVFAQDWFFTILTGSYVGFGYTVWLGVIALLLVDIVANGARFTTWVCNAVLEMLGSAVEVVPC